jgi:hypothetical protein
MGPDNLILLHIMVYGIYIGDLEKWGMEDRFRKSAASANFSSNQPHTRGSKYMTRRSPHTPNRDSRSCSRRSR